MQNNAGQVTKTTSLARFQLVDLCLGIVGICVILQLARWLRLQFVPALLTVITATVATAITQIRANRHWSMPYAALAGAAAWTAGAAIVKIWQPSTYHSPLGWCVWCFFPIYGATVCVAVSWGVAKAIHFARFLNRQAAIAFRVMVALTLIVGTLLVISGEHFFGTPTGIVRTGSIKCCASSVCSLAFSEDGSTISAGCQDGTLSIFDAENGRLIATTSLGDSVYAVAFTADGAHLLSGGADGQVKSWNPSNLKLLRTEFIHSDCVRSLVASLDSRLVISGSGSSSKGVGEIKLWDSVDGAVLSTHAWPGEISSLAYSGSGEVVAASNSGWNTVKVLDSQFLTILQTLDGHTQQVRAVAFAPTEPILATVASSGGQSPEVFLWDIKKGAITKRLRLPTCFLSSVLFSPDGLFVYAGGSGGAIYEWTVTGDLRRILRGHPTEVTSLAISPNGATVAAGGRDGTISFWESSK